MRHLKMKDGTKIRLLPPPEPPEDEVTCPNCHLHFDLKPHRRACVVSCGHVYCLECFINKLNLRQDGCQRCEEEQEQPLPVEEVIQQQVDARSLMSSPEDESQVNDGGDVVGTENVSSEEPLPVEDPKPPKKSRSKLPPHVTLLPGQPPMYKCNLCKKTWKTKNHITYHAYCDKPSNFPRPFQCPICDKGFIAKAHFNYHLLRHNNECPYNCIFCNTGFNQNGKLIRHLLSHTGEKPYMCQKCPKSFGSNEALRDHETIKHNPNQKIFPCPSPNCHKMFATEERLKKHEALGHSSKPSFNPVHRPYSCVFCVWSFENVKDLRRHILTHTGERPFLCRKCGEEFNRKDNLRRHIASRHDLSKKKINQLVNEA